MEREGVVCVEEGRVDGRCGGVGGGAGMMTELRPLLPTGPSWEWLYTVEGGHVKLKFEEHAV